VIGSEAAPTVAAGQSTAPPQFERSFRLFVESVKDYAIFMLDTTGVVVSWNIGAERLKGYAPAEIIGRHFSTFYSEEDIRAQKPQRELEIAVREGRVEDEGWRLRKDGSRFWANVIITALRDADGRLTGFGKVTRDMTDIRERLEDNRRLAADLQRHALDLEEQVARRTRDLQEANAELLQANAALQTFAHSIAHDLRGPLRTLQGFADILIEDHTHQLDDAGRDYVRRMGAAARRLAELVHNLLTYARLARSGVIAAHEPVSWDRVIDTTVSDLRSEIQKADALIDVRRPLGCVMGHRETLAVVAQNLLTNAIKFVPAGRRPHVRIWTEAHGDRLRLNVEDNGIGIPPREQARVFSPFERLHANAVYAGTGLGLAIVAEATHRLHGQVAVRSDGQSGSCFSVELRSVPE
jgi:PAS domain S-box-containing protein